MLTAKSLFSTDSDVDVVPGDRIRTGGTADNKDSGIAYMVTARGEADVNPFTGWQPYAEFPLERVEG